MNGQTKACTRCKLVKYAEDFSLRTTRTGKIVLRSECKACKSIETNARQKRQRQELVADLGGACACCGEDTYEFLQIDHINNNGHEYRNRTTRKSLNIPQLRAHIQELQLLCGNCHNAKTSFGLCPHKEVALSGVE